MGFICVMSKPYCLLNPFLHRYSFQRINYKTAFENIVGKGEIASFPTVFSNQSDNCIPICPYFSQHSLLAAELEEPKIGISDKGLTLYFMVKFQTRLL